MITSLPDAIHSSALLLLFLAWIVQRDGGRRRSVRRNLRCLAWALAVTLSGSTLGGVYILTALIDAHKGRQAGGVVSWPRFWMGPDSSEKRTSSPTRAPRRRGR